MKRIEGNRVEGAEALDVVARARRQSVVRSLGVVTALLAGFSVYAINESGTQLYLQRVIDGTTNGVLYGAVALSLVLVFKATRVINFSQGAMATLGAFFAFRAFDSWSLPVWLAVVLAMVVSAVVAALLERTLIRPFDPDNHLAITIVTLGLFIALNALTGFIWGFDPRGFPGLFPHNVDDYVDIGGARLYHDQIGTAALVLLTVLAINVLLARTNSAWRCGASPTASRRRVCSGSTSAARSWSAGPSRRRPGHWPPASWRPRRTSSQGSWTRC